MISVSDARSNANDQVVHAATVLSGRTQRLAVFRAIYRGKPHTKRVSQLMSITGLNRKRVLTAGKALANNGIITQLVEGGETAYRKDPFYAQHRDRILRLALDRNQLAKVPTKTSPSVSLTGTIGISLPKSLIRVSHLTIDDIDSFSAVKPVRIKDYQPTPLDERQFKTGLQAMLREEGSFRDWGGERNDLWTTRLTYKGKRHPAAFAFKGKGTRGKLTPGKMGKNGDQVQRLFDGSAAFFFVQYWREIDQSVVDLMRSLAIAKSVTEHRRIHYCIIDGQDSQRLLRAYSRHFERTT